VSLVEGGFKRPSLSLSFVILQQTLRSETERRKGLERNWTEAREDTNNADTKVSQPTQIFGI
jgi:hypothetical protein